MRQTNVVVIPNCDEIAQFKTFDTLIQAINQARRRAREFVIKLDKDDDDQTNDNNNLGKDWVVAINCAHLHPQYGMQTPEEQLASMKHEEEEGEVDLNLQEYKKRRDEARRSPYPSLIVEVQSTPPPDFGAAKKAAEEEMKAVTAAAEESNPDDDVTSDDVKKLEALFGMSAATKKADDPFYDALGEVRMNTVVVAFCVWLSVHIFLYNAKIVTYTLYSLTITTYRHLVTSKLQLKLHLAWHKIGYSKMILRSIKCHPPSPKVTLIMSMLRMNTCLTI